MAGPLEPLGERPASPQITAPPPFSAAARSLASGCPLAQAGCTWAATITALPRLGCCTPPTPCDSPASLAPLCLASCLDHLPALGGVPPDGKTCGWSSCRGNAACSGRKSPFVSQKPEECFQRRRAWSAQGQLGRETRGGPRWVTSCRGPPGLPACPVPLSPVPSWVSQGRAAFSAGRASQATHSWAPRPESSSSGGVLWVTGAWLGTWTAHQMPPRAHRLQAPQGPQAASKCFEYIRRDPVLFTQCQISRPPFVEKALQQQGRRSARGVWKPGGFRGEPGSQLKAVGILEGDWLGRP